MNQITIEGTCADELFIDTDHGILSWSDTDKEKRPFADGDAVIITITKKPQPEEESFYVKLAKALRPLWPAGDKDGKWAWRAPVDDLSRRLETLWRVRNLGEYSIETCVEIANKYLARYRDNAKYMQVLKYFILKQKKLVQPDGKIRFINTSVFADMLENATVEELQQKEFEELLENACIGEGRLI